MVAAQQRIRPHVRQTPVEPSASLGEATGCEVLLKLENFQITGSFKLRGAMHKLLASSGPGGAAGPVVAASAGNHGAAVAWGARRLGRRAVIFLPATVSPARSRAVARLGAEVVLEGDDCAVSEAAARRYAEQRGLVYISPYNDLAVVAGQGTVAAELHEQAGPVDAVFVALGGGGLVSGIGGYLRGLPGHTEVIACSPENSRVMHESVAAGRILELESQPTLSESTAGGLEAGAVTLELCRDLVDRFVLVPEAKIAPAMRQFIEEHHMLIEGAAAVAIAGLLSEAGRWHGKRAAVVVCGANVSADQLRAVFAA